MPVFVFRASEIADGSGATQDESFPERRVKVKKKGERGKQAALKKLGAPGMGRQWIRYERRTDEQTSA